VNVSDRTTLILIGAVLVLLGVAWLIVKVLKRRPESGIDMAILETFHLRCAPGGFSLPSWRRRSSSPRHDGGAL